MQTVRYLFAVPLAFALVLGACDDDDDGGDITTPGGEISQSDLAGTWIVQTYQCTSASDPTVVWDPFQSGIGLITVTVAPNGQYQAEWEPADPLGEGRSTSGQITVNPDGTISHTKEDGTVSDASISVDDATGDLITITEASTTADLDNDPATPDEPAACSQTWQRNVTDGDGSGS